MDEYDAAINNAFVNNFDYNEYKQVIALFRSINESAFKGNDNV